MILHINKVKIVHTLEVEEEEVLLAMVMPPLDANFMKSRNLGLFYALECFSSEGLGNSKRLHILGSF
jgi:hypothetical protein